MDAWLSTRTKVRIDVSADIIQDQTMGGVGRGSVKVARSAHRIVSQAVSWRELWLVIGVVHVAGVGPADAWKLVSSYLVGGCS